MINYKSWHQSGPQLPRIEKKIIKRSPAIPILQDLRFEAKIVKKFFENNKGKIEIS